MQGIRSPEYSNLIYIAYRFHSEGTKTLSYCNFNGREVSGGFLAVVFHGPRFAVAGLLCITGGGWQPSRGGLESLQVSWY